MIRCFYCGKGFAEKERQIEWKGHPNIVLNFHPQCLVTQVMKMRQAINDLRKAGWV